MPKGILAAVFAWTSCLVGGCADRDAYPPTTTTVGAAESEIAAALRNVLNRTDSPFATIEHPPSTKFVQFVGARGTNLMLDVPRQTLSDDEFTRAQAFFDELGGTLRDGTQLGDVWLPEVFQLTLARDPHEAARLTLRFFREVYQLPEDADLAIQVDSG